MCAWALLLLSVPLAAQTPSFEVASIRPSTSLVTPVSLCGNLKLSPESVLASVVYRLDIIIAEAYRDQVDDWDLPQWTRNSGTFALSVKVPPNTNTEACRQMLRNFLAERFHMVLDVETGLTGYYDGEFVFSATASLRSEFADSVEDAVSRQLGLTLERWRGPGKVLVVKSSDPMPTEN